MTGFELHPPQRQASGWPLVLAGAALTIAGYLLWDRLRPDGALHSGAEPRAIAARGDLMDFEKTTVAIYEQNRASVVHITTEAAVQTGFFGGVEYQQGTGSGFVWDARGYVVTNFHVIANQDRVVVRLADQVEYDAQVVGARSDLDIAVLKVVHGPPELRPIAIGSSADLKVGQSVFAIGNPFGLDATLTTGVVSALDRTIESVAGTPIPGCIQVDAAINPGNSGGPLLDSAGRLIGMNTAIKSPSGASAGIGFAVPIDTINVAVPRLISGEADQLPVRLGIQMDYWRNQVVVTRVVAGSGAEVAGLLGMRRSPTTGRALLGDILVSIDGKKIRHAEDVRETLRTHKPGDQVRVEVVRGLPYEQKTLSLAITLSEW